jgi:hypothetical protein
MIVYITNQVSTETWNTGRMIPIGTNSSSPDVSLCYFCYVLALYIYTQSKFSMFTFLF